MGIGVTQLTNNEIIQIIVEAAVDCNLPLQEIQFNKFGILWIFVDDSGGGQRPASEFKLTRDEFYARVHATMNEYLRHLKQG